ncbi:MAG: AI-2E family transporter [Candidatus Gracilibacteria bacterium]|nr:AI-2E family transporter [Candidatus Gracilibacteria bacterium]
MAQKILRFKKKEYSFLTKLIILSFFIICCLFIYEISNLLIILGLGLFLNILFSPLLNKFNKWKISDGIGITIIYILILITIFVLLFSIVPIFIKQFALFLNILTNGINNSIDIYNTKGIDGFNLPEFVKNLLLHLDVDKILTTLKENIGQISFFITNNLKDFLTSGIGLISGITNFIANLVMLFIFTFFIALERKGIRQFFYDIIPKKTSKYLLHKEDKILKSLNDWIKGQLILGISIFTLTLIGLLFIRLFGVVVEEFIVLSIIAGMMEFIPYIGPFIALIPALAIGLGLGFNATLIILVLYIIIQQSENNILVPYVMGKNLSISPFSVLIAMVIGASLFGIIGIILSIPMVSIVKIFIHDYIKYKNKD